jgi:hypothetical protein
MREKKIQKINEQRYIVACLDGLQVKVNALRELQSASEEELSPSLRFGDAMQSALMPSILDKAFKGGL